MGKPTIIFLTLFVLASFQVKAFQSGDGKSKTAKPTPTPKPAAPSKPVSDNESTRKSSTSPSPKPVLTGEATLKTIPAECVVSLDGKSRGTTNQDGILNLPNLTSGTHIVVVSKTGYQKEERQISVSAKQSQTVQLTLTPLPVSLTVQTNVTGAAIQVDNKSYMDVVSNLPLVPGLHQVRVSKPGYRSVTMSVELRPAKPERMGITLERVPVETLLAQAEQDFVSHHYPQVIPNCLDILAIQSEQPRANALLGQSYFYTEKFAESVSYLVKAIQLGEQITLPVKHHHVAGFSMVAKSDDFCSGQLILRKKGIEFQTNNTKDSFSTTPDKIYELGVEPHKNTTVKLHTKVGILKGKKEEKRDFNFFANQAELRKRDPNAANSIIDAYCQGCQPAVESLHQLVQEIKK